MRLGIWLPAFSLILSCASSPHKASEPEHYGYTKNGKFAWARGPWEAVEPSVDVDEVIDQLCPAIMKLPAATLWDYGQEYCGVIYTIGDGVYYASVPSPLGKSQWLGATKRKSCYLVTSVRDSRGRARPLIDFHSHPWFPSPMSVFDRQGDNQWYFIRIQFDTKCHIQKLIPYAHEDRPGELYERRGKSWKLIGYIYSEDKASGRVTVADDD